LPFVPPDVRVFVAEDENRSGKDEFSELLLGDEVMHARLSAAERLGTPDE